MPLGNSISEIGQKNRLLREPLDASGKPRLRELEAAGAGPATCAERGPALAVSRLSRALRRSQGSLSQPDFLALFAL
jgi:hypothetical protein